MSDSTKNNESGSDNTVIKFAKKDSERGNNIFEQPESRGRKLTRERKKLN